MKYTLATLGLATAAYAQAVTQAIKPEASAPAECDASYSGKFEIAVRSFAKRDLEKRECSGEGALVMTLNNGVLHDSKERTGYVAENYQFQFDKPPQAGAIYTAGFSACGNSSLALGGSAVWYQCLSGNFYNLYDRNWAKQCEPVLLQMVPCGGGSAGGAAGGGAGGVYTTTVIDQIGDGQPQVKPTVVTQIGDGQIQAPTDVVTQIGDGQIQVPPSAPPVTQIGDGQIQAPTGQAPKPPVVSQIGDGQIQAPPSASASAAPKPPVVSQIGDGQIQAPTSAAPPVVTQIGDGQIQAPTSAVSPPPAETTPATIHGSGAAKAFPATLASLAVAMIGFVLYL